MHCSCIYLYFRQLILSPKDVVSRLPQKWREQLSISDQLFIGSALFAANGQVVEDPQLWYIPSEYKPSGLSPPQVNI